MHKLLFLIQQDANLYLLNVFDKNVTRRRQELTNKIEVGDKRKCL